MSSVRGPWGAVNVTATPALVGPAGNSGIGPDTSWPSARMAIGPAGRTPPGGVVLTNTVKVTSSPPAAGLWSLVIVVEVSARLTVWPTLAGLGGKFASPL